MWSFLPLTHPRFDSVPSHPPSPPPDRTRPSRDVIDRYGLALVQWGSTSFVDINRSSPLPRACLRCLTTQPTRSLPASRVLDTPERPILALGRWSCHLLFVTLFVTAEETQPLFIQVINLCRRSKLCYHFGAAAAQRDRRPWRWPDRPDHRLLPNPFRPQRQNHNIRGCR